MFRKHFDKWFQPSSHTARRGRRKGQRPAVSSHRAQLECLEDRTMPAVSFFPQLSHVTPPNNTDVARGLATAGVPAVEPQITVNPLNPAQIALSTHGLLQVSNDGGATYPNPASSFPL